MLHQSTTMPAPLTAVLAGPPDRVAAPRPAAWLGNALLALASVMLLSLAGASAWLSYHAQVDYVLAHNGEQTARAHVWALLLDSGTAGVSLLRLYETLRARPGLATRVSLLSCIAASVMMNLLHAPSRTPGGCLVAAVPPVMYAVFLEHLLANLRSMLIAEEKRRGMWRALALWFNFPRLMWSTRRDALRRDAEGHRPTGDTTVCGESASNQPCVDGTGEVQQGSGVVVVRQAARSVQRTHRGRGPGAKRIAFEAALAEQARSGDLRLFSGDERVRNAAAYQAAASLPVPLSRGAARRYVVQALPRLEGAAPLNSASESEVAPEVG